MARRVLASLLAGGAVAGSVALARTPPDGPSVSVVVAARQLSAGAEVGPGDVRVADLPARAVPDRAVNDLDDVLGRSLSGAMGTGEVVTPARLLGPGLLTGQPAGQVAAHLPVADAGAVAMVRPGDRVDVLSAGGERLAEAVVVLAVDAAGAGVSAGWQAAGVQPAGVVVAVTPEAASGLAAHGSDGFAGGALTLVVRNVT